MSLKSDCKKTLQAVYSSEGIPQITDKTFNTMWETFAKTQPSVTSLAGATYSGDGLSGVAPPQIWETLEFNLTKFGIDKKLATKIVAKLKKKYGDNPKPTEIGAFMSN
ncbi:hypothetical protein Bhyg_00973 [Pseudolycoriella hygida]|uniref:Uncharacterized protein n=1 Tax=Pseudolycoriella hygida TaxID=35572 RepID=A0A9Q0N8V5_9DIPT|nr:hypothetical protein Bhyg_00973 [Pseudolycoriella hygida]